MTATPRAALGTWGEDTLAPSPDTLALTMDTLALVTDTLAHRSPHGPEAMDTHTQIQVGARTREFPYSGWPYSTRQ